ncbi:MAG: exodeoxyribonuclease VII large subunit [Candidatus Omnitrophica bacterium]|nr:exodeoxyribonuclease VII large subunit [Candidatus Omnitrophota bacterium]
MDTENTAPKIYTVSDINRQARLLIEAKFSGVWVEGEVSNFKLHSSGHMYLSLKDSASQISAAFFSRSNQGLKFQLKDGLKVVAFGRLSLYEARGQYQFYIERVEPKGLGALQLAFLQLRDKLHKEGLFDAERKRPIPQFPRTVGLITSPTGAAIRDMLQVINRRSRGTSILLNPVRVQGEGAAQEIARAIEEMNELPEGEVDVLIVGRGGGSLEDLWAFNEEIVARAVHRSRIPVISAVGHEIDWTICDWVADLRAPTPSAAAELVVQNTSEILDRVEESRVRIHNAARNYLMLKKKTVASLLQSYAFEQPRVLLDQFSQRFDDLFRQLNQYVKSAALTKQQAFHSAAGQLRTLNPLAILERGYSLTFLKDGELLKQVNQVRSGDKLATRVTDGVIYSTVTGKED